MNSCWQNREEAKAEKRRKQSLLKRQQRIFIINDPQEKVKETNQENANQKQEDSVENGQADAQSAQTSQQHQERQNRKLQQRQQIALAGQRKYPYELQHG